MFLKSLFIEKLISTVYLANSQSGQTDTLDSLPVLTSLNKLNGTSLNHLAKLIISTNNSNNKVDKDLLYKIITLLSINCDKHVATLFLTELFQLKNEEAKVTSYEESILIKLRQELNSFHPTCISEVVFSLLKLFTNEPNEDRLGFFIQNLTSIYEWDIQNQHFMRFLFYLLFSNLSLLVFLFSEPFQSKNISSILIENDCFTNMISHISINDESKYSYSIIELYNKILTSDEDIQLLRLSLSDLIQIAHKLVEYFFGLASNINGILIFFFT
jgi:hypothetical protein